MRTTFVRMIIGFDAKRFFFNRTGLGNYSRALIGNLTEQTEVKQLHLYVPGVPGIDHKPLLASEKIEVHRILKPLQRVWGVTRLLNEQGVELYHGLSNELPFSIRRANCKTIVTVHDLIFKAYPETYPFIDRQIYDLKSKFACQQADHVITISERTKQDIIHHYGTAPEKISVIAPIMDANFFQPDRMHDDTKVLDQYGIGSEFLLSVGTIERRKNLETTLRALAGLPKNSRRQLVVVGRGKAYRKQMQSLSTDLGLADTVIWLERLDELDDLAALYRRALLLVYPSRYEGFGMPVVEALLSGTPVITSNLSSLPEAGGPGALLVDPEDPSALGEAILKLTRDSALRDELAQEGKSYALERYHPDVLTEKLLKVYRNVLAG